MGKLNFILPLYNYDRISDPYGWRIHPKTHKRQFHSGIDYAIGVNHIVKASESGKVVRASIHIPAKPGGGSFGNLIVIDHAPNKITNHTPKEKKDKKYIYTLYGHLNSMLVKTGDYVEQHEVIGESGSTGTSTGPHLHFSVYEAQSALSWNKTGNTGVTPALAKDPLGYIGKSHVVDGTLPDIVGQAIMDRVEFVPDIDLKRKDPFRMQAWLDGKYLGYVNKYTGGIEANIDYDLKDELGKIWRKPLWVHESRPIKLEYKIELQ